MTRQSERSFSPALVLIPGLLCDQALWKHQIQGLARSADIQVADTTRQRTLSEMAAAVLTAAPSSFSLAGFSLGSQVALEIMRMSPQRVCRLALLSASRGGLLPSAAASLRQAVTAIEGGGFEQYLEMVYPLYVTPARAADLVLKRCFLEMAHAVGPEAGLRQMRALLPITAPLTDLNQIRCPTVIVGGREDRRTPPALHEALAQEIPGSDLVLVNEAAHFTPLEQPGIVTEVLQHWLTREARRTSSD